MTVTLRPHQQRITDRMLQYAKGQIIVPTGGGKTLTGIIDAQRRFSVKQHRTIVVVAPRILLAEQLSSEYLEHITNANVLHVHSGETKHFSTTKSDRIKLFVDMCQTVSEHVLIFTTYNSSIVSWSLVLLWILFTLTRHITASSVTSSLLLSISLTMQIVATSSLQRARLL